MKWTMAHEGHLGDSCVQGPAGPKSHHRPGWEVLRPPALGRPGEACAAREPTWPPGSSPSVMRAHGGTPVCCDPGPGAWEGDSSCATRLPASTVQVMRRMWRVRVSNGKETGLRLQGRRGDRDGGLAHGLLSEAPSRGEPRGTRRAAFLTWTVCVEWGPPVTA